jgi:hypothetical protein
MEIRCAYRELLNPKTLKPHPANPNEHGQDQIDLFVEILKYQGWRRPITVSIRSGYITKGHGALAAAIAAGCDLVPVDYQDYKDEAQELADIVADNQLQRMSKMNMGKLQQIVTSLDTVSVDLSMTGLDSIQLQSLRLVTNPLPPPPPPEALLRDSRYANPVDPAPPEPESTSDAEYVNQHYQGMPEFNQQDLSPKRQITVNFASEQDFQEFFNVIGQRTTNHRSIWFPEQPIEKAVDKRYTSNSGE